MTKIVVGRINVNVLVRDGAQSVGVVVNAMPVVNAPALVGTSCTITLGW